MDSYEPNSIRYERYKRDKTRRGRSLALAQVLLHLGRQPEYKDFSEILQSASLRIRETGAINDKTRRARILEALGRYATEIGEICDDAGVTRADALKVLNRLVKQGLVVIRYRNDFLKAGEPAVMLYFLAEAVADLPDSLEVRPATFSLNRSKA